MTPLTDSPIAQQERWMTYSEYDAAIAKAFEDGKQAGFALGYRAGRLDLLNEQTDALINTFKPGEPLSDYSDKPYLNTRQEKKVERVGKIRI